MQETELLKGLVNYGLNLHENKSVFTSCHLSTQRNLGGNGQLLILQTFNSVINVKCQTNTANDVLCADEHQGSLVTFIYYTLQNEKKGENLLD